MCVHTYTCVCVCVILCLRLCVYVTVCMHVCVCARVCVVVCVVVCVCFQKTIMFLQADMEVVVDAACGMAVLRGADVFKQGILGAPTGNIRLTRFRQNVQTDSV